MEIFFKQRQDGTYFGEFHETKPNGYITQAELPTIEPTASDLINAEYNRYLKRKTDGENAYLMLSAEFRMAKLSGQISEQAHLYIENLLKPVRDEIMFGQWKEALRLLEAFGVEQVGSELYNRLHLQISDYITENY